MTLWNGNIFCVTDPLWGESSGQRRIPLTQASDAELWCFLWSAPEYSIEQAIAAQVIWDLIALIMTVMINVLRGVRFKHHNDKGTVIRSFAVGLNKPLNKQWRYRLLKTSLRLKDITVMIRSLCALCYFRWVSTHACTCMYNRNSRIQISNNPVVSKQFSIKWKCNMVFSLVIQSEIEIFTKIKIPIKYDLVHGR